MTAAPLPLFDDLPEPPPRPAATSTRGGWDCPDCGVLIPPLRGKGGRAPERCATCTPIHRAAARRSQRSGLTVEEEKAKGPAETRHCADCGATFTHVWEWAAGHPPERCATCRPIHLRALARAKNRGTTVEEEKARMLTGDLGLCDVCGKPLGREDGTGADGRQLRTKRHRGECRTIYQRAYVRAHKHGTDLAEEIARTAAGGTEGRCATCGAVASHINRSHCQECIDNGARRVYMRARSTYGADHQAAVELATTTSCAVCGTGLDRRKASEADRDRMAVIDHCHSSGQVRGMLCHPCNVALGHMKDDPARLRAAADYLDRRNSR
jgi:hypothetical protein